MMTDNIKALVSYRLEQACESLAASILHRWYKKKFQLKFASDRRQYLQWLFETKKRFSL